MTEKKDKLVPSLILNIFLLNKDKANTEGSKVIGVIDGDTFVLEGKVRVRLRGLDAPELQTDGPNLSGGYSY